MKNWKIYQKMNFNPCNYLQSENIEAAIVIDSIQYQK